MENTSQQLDQMQEMVNRLIAEQAKLQQETHKGKTPVAIPVSNVAQQPPRQTATPQPQAKPQEANIPTKSSVRNRAQLGQNAGATREKRPDKKDFYDKTWVALAAKKKFPFSEKDIRVELTNTLYAELKDIYFENEPLTRRIMKKIDFTNSITIGSRTDKVTAKIKELGLVYELDINGILKIGEEESGW